MKHQVKASVIIPIYNAAAFLPECLESVLDQTLTDIEIICINNGSSDKSLSILKKFAQRDSRIQIINTPRSNAGTARNIGLKVARGQYLSFIDADDFCELNMLETTYNLAVKHSSDLVVFDFYTFDDQTKTRLAGHSGIFQHIPNSTFSPAKIQPYLFGAFKNCPWNKLFRKDFIVDNQIAFQEIPRGNDIFFTYMSLALSRKITTTKTPLTNYRINNQSSLQSTNELSPLSFWDAFKYLKTQLQIKGLYEKYEQSFLTELLNNAIYNLEKLPQNSNAYNYLFNTIRYGTEIEYHISAHSASYYNPDSYRKYQEILHAPTTEELIIEAVEIARQESAIDTAREIKSSKTYKIGSAITKLPRSVTKFAKRGVVK